MAVIAVEAGVRAEIWVMAVPSCTREVALPHHANGVKQSDPYASDIHTLLNPRRSAAAICAAASGGGPEDGQYPMMSPSCMSSPLGSGLWLLVAPLRGSGLRPSGSHPPAAPPGGCAAARDRPYLLCSTWN